MSTSERIEVINLIENNSRASQSNILPHQNNEVEVDESSSSIIDLTHQSNAPSEVHDDGSRGTFGFTAQGNGTYRITKNLSVKFIETGKRGNYFFNTDHGGFATVIVNTDGQAENDFLGHGTSYCLAKRKQRETNIFRHGEAISVSCTTWTCSGIKCCQNSEEKCSKFLPVSHTCDTKSVSIREALSVELETRDAEQELARQVFLWAQTNFPVICKHVRNVIEIESNNRRLDFGNVQRRTPNWVFRSGKYTGSSMSSRLGDFIGCNQFGEPGLVQYGCCDLRPLPANLQGADGRIIQSMLYRATIGITPEAPRNTFNCCAPLPTKYSGKFCKNFIHGVEAVPIIKLDCPVRYHYLVRSENEIPVWAVVIGYGVHSHSKPISRPQSCSVTRHIGNLMDGNKSITTKEVCESISSQSGFNAPYNSVRKTMYGIRRLEEGTCHGLHDLIRKYCMESTLNDTSYIFSIVDERHLDSSRKSADQVGVSILMCNRDLLKRCVSSPHLGCDGTFKVVSENNPDGLIYELNTIVARDKVLGTTYAVMRQICSRKTTAARKLLFRELVTMMCKFGLSDPLTSDPKKRMSMTTDYETTYALAFGQALTEHFHPTESDGDMIMLYIQLCCFGCDVHSKRAIMEKIDIFKNLPVYRWAVGTRRTDTAEGVRNALNEMHSKGANWSSFARWFERNEIARILWFQSYNKQTSWGSHLLHVMQSTNPNESSNYRIKALPDYRKTMGRGLQLTMVLDLLEKMDDCHSDNIYGRKDLQKCSTPGWSRTRRGKKRPHNEVLVELNGENVCISQPKRSRRRV